MIGSLTAKFAALLLAFTCVGSAWGAADTSWYDADQTSFTLTTEAQLRGLAQLVNAGNSFSGKTITLGADIDVGSEEWVTIATSGDDSTKFAGTFDGDNHTISNLVIDQSDEDPVYRAAGFFGAINGTVKNLKFVNANVTGVSSGSATVNGIAVAVGSMAYGGTIDNVSVENATIKGNRYVAGIVGFAKGTVQNCTIKNVTIVAKPDKLTGSYDNGDKCGGIVGYCNGAVDIENNTIEGNLSITGYRDIGGIVGCDGTDTTISGNKVADNANVSLIVDQVTNSYGDKTPNAGIFRGRNNAGQVTDETIATLNTISASATTSISTAVAVAQVKVGSTTEPYTNIDEAVAVWTANNNSTLTLLADVTLSDTVHLTTSSYHTLNLSTFTLTGPSNKDVIQIDVGTLSHATYVLDVEADATTPGKIVAVGSLKAAIRYNKTDSTISDRPIITIKGGVFEGYYGIKLNAKNGGAKSPYVHIRGGTFNNSGYGLNFDRATTYIYDGAVFNCDIYASVDSTARMFIQGGKFKSVPPTSFAADLPEKWTYGTDIGTYDRDIHVDSDGYYVVSSPITAVADKPSVYGASLNNTGTGTLACSNVKTEGRLYYATTERAMVALTAGGDIELYTDCADNKTLSKNTTKITLKNGATYSGTIKLDGTDAKVVIDNADGTSNAQVVSSVPGYVPSKSVSGSATTISLVPESEAFVAIVDDTYYYSDLHAALEAGKAAGSVVKLLQDINLAGVNWEPVGTTESPFSGSIDGNGKTISNLTVNNQNLDYAGLIGYGNGTGSGTKTLTIKDLTIANASITARMYAGVLGGCLYSYNSINNVKVQGLIQVTGNYKVGGVVGGGYIHAYDSSIAGDEGSFVKGLYLGAKGETVNDSVLPDDCEGDNVGGFIGHMGEGAGVGLYNCSSSGLTVMGSRKVGGLVGTLPPENTLENVNVHDITVGTTATAAYANDNKSTMEIGGVVGSYYNHGTGGVISGTVQGITIAELPEGITGTGDGKNISYGLVTGGNRGANPEPKLTWSGLTATGYDPVKYNNRYLLPKVAQIGDVQYVTFEEAIDAADADNVNEITILNGATESPHADWKISDGKLIRKIYVAQIGETKYETFAAALDAVKDGDTIQLLADIDATASSLYTENRIPISKSLTIDGQNHSITVAQRGFGVGMNASSKIDVTFKDVTINNSSDGARCIDTRGNLNRLTLDHVTLDTNGGSGYTQPLTIGGNQSDPATVSIVNGSKIQTNNDGTAYYAIITFNPVKMTIDHSTIKGWACIYAKGSDDSAGSAESLFTIKNSELVSNNGYSGVSNAFAMLMAADNNVTFNITNTEIDIDATGDQYQAIIATASGKTGVTANLGDGNTVTLQGENAKFAFNGGQPIVSGGTFNEPVPEQYCADGYIPTSTTKGGVTTYGVKQGTYVAQVVREEAVVGKYESLAEAFAAAADDDTVTLLRNIDDFTGTLTINKSLTLDGAGHTIVADANASGEEMFDVTGTATIKNITLDGVHNYTYCIQAYGGNATLTLENVTVLHGTKGLGDFKYGAGVHVNNANLIVMGNFVAFSGGKADASFPFTGILYEGGSIQFEDGATASIANPKNSEDTDLLLVGMLGAPDVSEADVRAQVEEMLKFMNVPAGFYPYTLKIAPDEWNNSFEQNKSFTGASPLPWNDIIDYGKAIMTAIGMDTAETPVEVGLLTDTVLPKTFTFEDSNFTVNGNGYALSGEIIYTQTPGSIRNIVLGTDETPLVLDMTGATLPVKLGAYVTVKNVVIKLTSDQVSVGSEVFVWDDDNTLDYKNGNVKIQVGYEVSDDATLEWDEDNRVAYIGPCEVLLTTTTDGKTKLVYTSLAEASKQAKDGDTIKLLTDISLSATQDISKSLTIDMNGFNITATDARALWIKEGTVEILDNSDGETKGTISAKKSEGNTSFADSSSVIRVGDSAANANAAALTVGEGVTVSSGHCYGITAFGTNAAGITLDVAGSVVVTGTAAAISGNGNSGLAKTDITIERTATVTATTDAAIYFPCAGTLAVKGGTISGPTAIYVKAGTLEITGGTITGTGAATGYVFNDNGANATGDALVVENCGYPNGEPTVEITGGTFRSTNAKAVGSYAKDSTFPVLTGFILPTGTALFSDDVSDGVPAGYELVPAGEGYDGLYKLAPLTGILYVTGRDANGKNRGVMMDVAWLKANKFIAGEVATQEELDGMQAALSESGDNGLPYWQSYVLGVDPNGTYPLTIAKGVSSGENYIITGKFAGSKGFNLTPSKNATMTVEFTLVERGAFDADAKDWAWTKVNGVTTNVSNTAAPQFTVSMDAVANQVLAISVTIMVDDKQ